MYRGAMTRYKTHASDETDDETQNGTTVKYHAVVAIVEVPPFPVLPQQWLW